MRRLALIVLGAVPLFALLIGPWPLDSEPYGESAYAATTFQRIEATAPDLRPGPLRGAVAAVDMTPPQGVPVAGYSARNPKANIGALDPIQAKALTLDNGHQDVTIVTGDFLLPMPALVHEVVRRTGLERRQIYFSATHTHSGPGGYARGFFAESALGEYDQAQFDRMAAALAKAVMESRAALSPVTVQAYQARLDAALARQLVADQFTHGPGHDTLNVLQMRDQAGGLVATLVTFGTHPTFLGKHNRKVSGDYPTRVQQILQSRLGGEVMFAVGAVGGNNPAPGSNQATDELALEIRQMTEMAKLLSRVVLAVLEPAGTDDLDSAVSIVARWSGDTAPISSLAVPVELPTPTYHISERLRLSPFFVNWLFHDGDTEISALRIGDALFVGYPADFSGELAGDIEKWSLAHGKLAWVTGFSGDYIGYVMPHQRYLTPHYTTRDANAFGPWAGEYFVDIGKRLFTRLLPGV